MLVGATGRRAVAGDAADVARREHVLGKDGQSIVTVLRRPWGIPGLDAADLFADEASSGSWLYLCGNPLMLAKDVAVATEQHRARELLQALSQHGLAALNDVDGAFALVWWNARGGSLHLLRDRFGMEPLFYAQRGEQLIFGSRIRDFDRLDPRPFELDPQGVVEFLTYCFVPGDATLDKGVRRVPAGGTVVFETASRRLTVQHWYRLSFQNPVAADEAQIASDYRQLLDQAVTRRLSGSPAGVFLSGGMDSSSVLTFMRRHMPGQIYTFGFRCAGNSFDESYYARALAQELATTHREVDYGEADSLTVLDAVRQMEVPFCDIGIEVGTWLLARRAGQDVQYLLTGDGGDELWASHPVYAAQRMVSYYDRMPLPKLFRRALQSLTSLVHDSERKRNMAVVIKRLLPGVDLPVGLGPFRWRVYYSRAQLQRLLQPSLASQAAQCDPYQSVLAAYDGYQGPDDGMSPHLYNDYVTASSFYFSRLLLARSCGIETRMPFYDKSLVEYGARIPAHLKLEGVERTKRLFRVAMEGVLPDVINHRKDKLGHSVPLKNWLRTTGPLGAQVRAALLAVDTPLAAVLRPELLSQWIDEHERMRHNHSHRIWAAFVLGAWLKNRSRR